jgi:PKD repeat protein
VINQSATVYIGEEGLNLTHALNQAHGQKENICAVPGNTRIGWWASAGSITSTAPTRTFNINSTFRSYTIMPSNFVGYTGNWYLLDNTTGSIDLTNGGIPQTVVVVADPSLDLEVWNFDTASDVSGRTAMTGSRIGFKIKTNMYNAVDSRYRSPVTNTDADGYIDIKIQTESATWLTELVTGPGTTVPLTHLVVRTQPCLWPSSDGAVYWQTDAKDGGNNPLYPEGTYTVFAESKLNMMKDNYRNAGADYTGKTVSQHRTITLVPDALEIEANRDSVIRTARFSVTIQGKPSTQYYLWVKDDGKALLPVTERPPSILPSAPVIQDPPAGPYPIGSHPVMGGGGATIRDVVPPSTLDPTLHYASVITNKGGYATVEFQTWNATRPATYTLHVEAGSKTHEVGVEVEDGNSPASPEGINPAKIILNPRINTNVSTSDSTDFRRVEQGVTLFIGEEGLNVTAALNQAHGDGTARYQTPVSTRIGWWAAPWVVTTTAPTKTVNLNERHTSLTVEPSDFVGYTGNWYLVDPVTGMVDLSNDGTPQMVFNIQDPILDIKIWDLDISTDVSGRSVPQGERLTFQINTNMYPATYGTRPDVSDTTPGFITIKVKNENGATYNFLYQNNTTAYNLTDQFVNMQPYFWKDTATRAYSVVYWGTDLRDSEYNFFYPVGTYTVSAESTLSRMKENYKNAGADYTGKTVSQAYTVTLVTDTLRIEANKDVVVRGKPFSVTITGKPLGVYHVWVNGTSDMNGGAGNQPPLVNLNQERVFMDPVDGPFDIGSYLFTGGGGKSIRDDIPPSGAGYSNTRNYAKIVTTSYGTRTVEFVTSNWTKNRTYSIRVENGTYTDSVPVIVRNGTVVITAAGNHVYTTGETIRLSGTNDETYRTYLFLVSRDYPQGTNLTHPGDPLINNYAGSFKRVEVNGDNTWSYRWNTSGIGLKPGEYTIYATSYPHDLAHLNESAHGSVMVELESVPTLVPDFISVPNTGAAPLTVRFTDKSAGSPTGWVWFFGDEDYSAPWTQKNASAGWDERYCHSSVTLPDGSIVLMGGYDEISLKNDVWRSTDKGATWTRMNASAGWSPRYFHTSVVTPDGSIFVMGGNTQRPVNLFANDVWRSTDKGATWTLMNDSAGWSPRATFSSVALPDGSIVVMGGNDGFTRNDVWRSTDNGATWVIVNADPGWQARWAHSSVVMPDGSIVLIGGWMGSYANDVWRSADSGLSWSQMNASAGWEPRGFFTSNVMPDGSIVLTGGYGDLGIAQDMWRSGDNGGTWTQINTSTGSAARYEHSTVSLPDGSLLLTGGVDTGGTNNDTWRFNPVGSSLQNPTHIYPDPGTYTVSLQSYNSHGYNSTRKNSTIIVRSSSLPTITTVTPSMAHLNSTINFTITGSGYDTRSGKTWINFTRGNGAGGFDNLNLTLTSITATQINGTMVINASEPGGNWDLTVTTVNGGKSLIRTGALAVTPAPAPVISTLTPATGTRNTTVNFTIAGTGFETGPGKTRMRIYEDSADTELPASIISTTPTTITGSVTIPSGALPGSYILEVYTVDGGTATKPAAFTVTYSSIPTITAVTPASGYRNTTVPYTITGTNFQPGLTTVTFRNQSTNAILGISEVNGGTSTTLTGNLAIPGNATTGPYRLDIITADGGVVNKRDAFRVETVKAPTIISLTPDSGTKGTQVAFTLTGTNFQPGKTSVRIVDDTTGTEAYTSLLGTTPTRIIGTFGIPATAPSGKYRLEVKTADGGETSRYEAFTVRYLGLPVITSLTPASGNRNSTVQFILKGGNFVDGGTTVRLRAPDSTIRATLTEVNTTTGTITGSFFIGANNVTGPYRLDVITTNGGFSRMQNAFTVRNAVSPSVGSISPASGSRGKTVAFTLKGSGFVAGGTSVKFSRQGTGSPGGVAELEPTLISVSPTQIIGSMAIPDEAAPDAWKIDVTTADGGTVTRADAFRVA